jgi:phenylacetate-CoA ligase
MNKRGLIERIYQFLPYWLQNYAISLFGYQWQKRRYGGIYEIEYERYKSRELFSTDQWKEYQIIELRKLVIHAFDTVPFYKDKYTLSGFKRNDLIRLNFEDLEKLPCLKKDDLRKFGKTTLLSSDIDKNGEYFASSGSTGTPTSIYISKKMHQKWTAAFESRIRNWAGVNRYTPRGTIGGRRIIQEGEAKPPFYRYNYFEKQCYFSAYHISPANAPDYIDGMKKYRLEYMNGYAMSNYLLAQFIKKNNLRAPQLKAIITSSEKLTYEMRELFKEVYGCKSFDSYSGVEGCGLISECEKGSLHISPDIAIIEIRKENGELAKPGESGEAICTGFLNYDQPLIRYKIGDMLKLSLNQICSCGRSMPIVEEIVGRTEDIVTGPDGRKMVRFHGIFVNISSIIEGQIIQKTINDFEIKVVVSARLKEDEIDIIRKRMDSQLGKINLTITEVDSISRNKNGKFRAVISLVKE